jgi:hypothetical protein
MKSMASIAFSGLLLIALLGIAGELIMRVRLSIHALRGEKLRWLSAGGDEIAAEYQQLYPTSIIPTFRACAFWGFLAIALILVIAIALKQRS